VARRLFLWLIKLIISLTCTLDVSGQEKIPKVGGSILAANHLGRLDAFLVYIVIQRSDIILTVAEKYRKFAFFRIAAKALDATWIERFNADSTALRKVFRRLKNGGILAIAPEGTRSSTGSLTKGKHGTAYLASKLQIPVLPVAVVGTNDHIVKSNIKKIKRTNVRVEIGDPISLSSLPRKDRGKALEEYTSEIMCHIAALLPQEYHGVYRDHVRLLELLED